MILIHFFAIVTLLLFAFCSACRERFSGEQARRSAVYILFGAALLLRLLIAYNTYGFDTDLGCWSGWADRMVNVGPSHFYSEDYFSDYPPGYLYVLGLLGRLRILFGMNYLTKAHVLLLKLPAILCDLATGWLIYQKGKKLEGEAMALLCSAAYLFLPVVILNSCCWGQVDSVLTLAVVAMCIYLSDGRLIPAYIAFGVGILMKSQMILFAPILIIAIIDQVFLEDFSWRKFWFNLASGILVIDGMFVLAAPFGISKVISLYTEAVTSYPYASVNAFNFWMLFGYNWTDQETLFGIFPCRLWGALAIVAAVIAVLYIGLRIRDRNKYFLLAALLLSTVFTFSVRMHERYIFPVLALLLLAYLAHPAGALLKCLAALSVCHFYSEAWVLYYYDASNYNAHEPIFYLVSGATVVAVVYFWWILPRLYPEVRLAAPAIPTAAATNATASTAQTAAKAAARSTTTTDAPAISTTSFSLDSLRRLLLSPKAPTPSGKHLVFTKLDLALLLVIMGIYSAFALYDLGDHAAPETTYDMVQYDTIELVFAEGSEPVTLAYYIAPWHNRPFTVETRNSTDEEWTILPDITLDSVFTWHDASLEGAGQYLRLTLTDTQASLIEFTFLDANGNITVPLNASDYASLFDESDLHPDVYTYRNGMYFDEIYHARSAYEMIHGLYTYENTHPPLGKILICVGIRLFGMNPFGWRIMGVLFGIAMLPFVYLFGKKMTDYTPLAATACALFAFDFMHLAQTRLATIDTYITFFVIAMYFFMYLYSKVSFYDTKLTQTFVPLGLSGLCMGLGVASKWTGVYAGLGLAVIFFALMLRRYREYLYAKQDIAGSTAGIAHRDIVKSFKPCLQRTIGFCVEAFVVVPVVIYTLAYIPFNDNSGNGLVRRMLDNINTMFSYHSTLEATHPYSSSWYQWPTMVRPIWYYSRIIDDNMREGISAFGNPLVWWIGIPAFLFLGYLIVRKVQELYRVSLSPAHGRGKHTTAAPTDSISLSNAEFATALFLVVGYLAQYLPWVGVTRITFIYHYFPSVPFVVLMIVFGLMQCKKKMQGRTFLIVLAVYVACTIGLFVLFYPVLTGQAIDYHFVAKYLRWFDSWVLVSGG